MVVTMCAVFAVCILIMLSKWVVSFLFFVVLFFVVFCFFFFFQAEDGIRDRDVTGVQTCALPICLWAVRIRVVACDSRGTRDAAHAPRSRPLVDPSGFLRCPWERALRPGARPARSRTCRTLRRCGTRRRAAGLPSRRARRGSDPILYRPCAYSSSSGVPSRTSTRIAACGTTRYFVPSNVISTAALRKNSA